MRLDESHKEHTKEQIYSKNTLTNVVCCAILKTPQKYFPKNMDFIQFVCGEYGSMLIHFSGEVHSYFV